MPIRIIHRNGTAAQWTTANPTLAEGEMGLETDTKKFKIGDGSTAWNALAYGGLQGNQGPQGAQGIQGPQGNPGATGATGATTYVGNIDGGNSSTVYGGNNPIDGGTS